MTVDSITLFCSTPIENILILQLNEDVLEFPIMVGENKITIPSKASCNFIKGSVKIPFIPSNVEPGSKDNRPLGICLKKIESSINLSTVSFMINEV